jgi:nicotinate phosphoribosyltransferase
VLGHGTREEARLHVASAEEVRRGEVSDVYFLRGEEVLIAEGENPRVVAEVRASRLPRDWEWGVLVGVEEVLWLLEGRPVEVRSLPEGALFFPEEPVLVISGRYLDFGILETAVLGLLCQATGVATTAARCKLAAAGRPVYSFGARRVHPTVAPMVERAAYLGGCDGVATVKAAELLGVDPVGTMSHALALILGDERAWRAFDRVVDPRVPRVALVDTFRDEKFGAVSAALTLGPHLAAVRVDTPASRRGDLPSLLREVRWELDERGFGEVRIFVSGGLDERAILSLNPYADAYGVGTWISNAPAVDFALDIVEVEGRPHARRGKLSGRKHLWGCPDCGNRGIASGRARLGACPRCGHRVRSLLETRMVEGRRRGHAQPEREVRARVLEQLSRVPDPFGREG